MEMYGEVVQLREKLMAAGGKDPGKIDTVQLLSDQSLHASGGGEPSLVADSTVTKEFVNTIQVQLDNVSKNLSDVCHDTLTKYSKVLHRLMGLRELPRDPEVTVELKEFEVDHTNLVRRLEAARKVADEFKSNVSSKIDILWSEIDTCRIRMKHLETVGETMANQLRAKLNNEAEKFKELNDRKCTTDGQLQKAKSRIKELEGRLESEKMEISQLQGNIKNLEGTVKQKDISGLQKVKELQKLLKSSEGAVAKLESQRDTLESRLIELKNESHNANETELLEKNNQLEEQVEILEKQLDTLQPELSRCKEQLQQVEKEKQEIEDNLTGELEEKSISMKEFQLKMEELQKNYDILQQKLKNLESAPPTSPRTPSKPENTHESPNIIHGSLEILKLNDELRNNIRDLKRRVKDLEAELNVQNTKFQQKDRLIREQSEVLKHREDMIAIMKAKNDKRNLNNHNQSGKDLVGKASLEELYSTLEDKQMRVEHLEKLVKQMEDHDRLAQEQRTRQEKHIAQLQLKLQAATKNENRYVPRGETHRHSAMHKVYNVPTGPPLKTHRTKHATVSFSDQKMRRSKTMTSFLPSNRFASSRDCETEDLSFTKMLDLERKYYECARAEHGFESFYQWLMINPSRQSRHSGSPRHDNTADSHYYNKFRNQCGRESRDSVRQSTRCETASKFNKYCRMSSKDPAKRY